MWNSEQLKELVKSNKKFVRFTGSKVSLDSALTEGLDLAMDLTESPDIMPCVYASLDNNDSYEIEVDTVNPVDQNSYLTVLNFNAMLHYLAKEFNREKNMPELQRAFRNTMNISFSNFGNLLGNNIDFLNISAEVYGDNNLLQLKFDGSKYIAYSGLHKKEAQWRCRDFHGPNAFR